MVDDVLDLQLVLVVGVMLGQVPELLGQVQTVLGELGTDEILSNLDAIVQISHLGIIKNSYDISQIFTFLPDDTPPQE